MENNSIEKNLSEIEIYSVTAIGEDFSMEGNHVTLDRGKALSKAYDMFYECEDSPLYYDVFIDTWKNDELIKVESIDSNGNIVVNYENYNV